jgi:hypothetical protein
VYSAPSVSEVENFPAVSGWPPALNDVSIALRIVASAARSTAASSMPTVAGSSSAAAEASSRSAAVTPLRSRRFPPRVVAVTTIPPLVVVTTEPFTKAETSVSTLLNASASPMETATPVSPIATARDAAPARALTLAASSTVIEMLAARMPAAPAFSTYALTFAAISFCA